MWRSVRFPRALVVATAALALLAGCATVPTSGPVEHHTPQATGVSTGVHVDPLPPSAGASQLLVVEGFLHAMSVYQPNYAVARQYLTAAASEAWHPESGVQIYADGYPPTEAGQTVILPAAVTGTIDDTGRYRPATDATSGYSPGKSNVHNFQLQKDDAGQWRIANPPTGLLVSRYVFSTSFVSVSLHFLAAGGSVLVPDPRFFADGDQAVAAAVRAQLAGPSAWLKPVVAKTETTDVTLLDVDVNAAGTAEVVLGGGAERLSAEQRRLVMAELAFTLAGFDQVTAVAVSSNGQTWRDDAGQSVVVPDSFAAMSPVGSTTQRTLFFVRDHKLQRLKDATDWTETTAVDIGLTKPEQVAVSADLTRFASTSQAGTRLQLTQAGADKPKLLRTGTGLLRPSFARNGELWSPAGEGLAALQVFKDDQRVRVRVDPPATLKRLASLPLVALAVSADGSRVAMIVRGESGTVLGLARVQRAEDGGIEIAGWRSIDIASNTGSTGRGLDVGWVSESGLMVLQTTSGSGESQTSSIVNVSEDGATATDIGPSEAVALSGLAVVPGRQAVALSEAGVVYRFDGEFIWNSTLSTVEAVAYSG